MNTFHFALLIGTLLLLSCAKPNQQDVKESEITINGLVTAITNGKDGYTANIKTKEKEVYTALVSISNHEGINIGDKATLQGKLLPSNDHHLIVSKILTVEKTIPIIKDDSFRSISPVKYTQVDK